MSCCPKQNEPAQRYLEPAQEKQVANAILPPLSATDKPLWHQIAAAKEATNPHNWFQALEDWPAEFGVTREQISRAVDTLGCVGRLDWEVDDNFFNVYQNQQYKPFADSEETIFALVEVRS